MRTLFVTLAAVVALASCKKENRECPSSITKEFNHTGFTRIATGENFSVRIKQGAAYSVKATGCVNDLNDLSVSVGAGNTLALAYSRYEKSRHRMDLEITLPALNSLSLDGAAEGEVTGFGGQATAMRTVVNGVAKCSVNALPALVRADVNGAGVLTLTGTATDLIAKLSGDGRLNAYTAGFTDADVYTSGTAKMYVRVQQSLAAFASGDSRIYYKGNPVNLSVEQSGTAKVIHE